MAAIMDFVVANVSAGGLIQSDFSLGDGAFPFGAVQSHHLGKGTGAAARWHCAKVQKTRFDIGYLARQH